MYINTLHEYGQCVYVQYVIHEIKIQKPDLRIHYNSLFVRSVRYATAYGITWVIHWWSCLHACVTSTCIVRTNRAPSEIMNNKSDRQRARPRMSITWNSWLQLGYRPWVIFQMCQPPCWPQKLKIWVNNNSHLLDISYKTSKYWIFSYYVKI